MDEFWILADLEHGIVPFLGSKEVVETHLKSLIKRCKTYGLESPNLCVSDKIDETEAFMIKKTRTLPRRVLFRLKKDVRRSSDLCGNGQQ